MDWSQGMDNFYSMSLQLLWGKRKENEASAINYGGWLLERLLNGDWWMVFAIVSGLVGDDR